MHVTSQHLVEQDIMKENSNRYILAYSSPFLQDNTVQNLDYYGEGQLRKNMMLNMTDIETSDERLKDRMKLFHNSTNSKMRLFVTVIQ